MSLYERNSIHYSEEEGCDVIYISFPCEDDQEYDCISISNLSKVVLSSSKIKVIDYATCKIKEANVNYKVEHSDLESSYVTVTVSLDDYSSPGIKMDLQDYADSIANSIYNNEKIDSVDAIKDMKERALEDFKINAFLANGVLVEEMIYPITGKIIDVNNNTIAIVNDFFVDITGLINLNGCVSLMSLKDAEVSKIEFITNSGLAFVINDFDIVNSEENLIRKYTLKPKAMYTIETSEDIVCDYAPFIGLDDDEYFDRRSTLLTDRETVFENVAVNEDIDDLFDDFDI